MDIIKQLQTGKETIALRLFAQPEQYGSGVTFHADIVYVKDASVNYVKSMGFYNNYFDEKHQYKGLTVSGHCYDNSLKPSCYEVHIENRSDKEVTLDKATQMVSVLRPINRKMVKLEIDKGHHGDFEEYVCRLAQVLKVKSFYHKSTSIQNDLTEYRVDDVSKLKQGIKDMITFNIQGLAAA
jgi:hypothetical protein